MILISLRGGTKTQRDLTEDAARYFIKRLCPRKRNLNLDINIRNLLVEDAAGYCMFLGGDDFEIELHNRGSLYQYLSYLAHELIHLKQYVRKELKTRGHRNWWLNEEWSGGSYYQQPWEKEAFALQYPLAKDFINEELGITYSKSKQLSPRTMKQIDWDMEVRILEKICDGKK